MQAARLLTVLAYRLNGQRGDNLVRSLLAHRESSSTCCKPCGFPLGICRSQMILQDHGYQGEEFFAINAKGSRAELPDWVFSDLFRLGCAPPPPPPPPNQKTRTWREPAFNPLTTHLWRRATERNPFQLKRPDFVFWWSMFAEAAARGFGSSKPLTLLRSGACRHHAAFALTLEYRQNGEFVAEEMKLHSRVSCDHQWSPGDHGTPPWAEGHMWLKRRDVDITETLPERICYSSARVCSI